MHSQSHTSQLDSEVALVTGGGSGIGYAITSALVAAGARVCISGRREQLLKEAQQAFGENVTYFAGDITQANDRKAMLAHAQTHFGADISILINNAGQNIKAPAVEVSDDSFSEVINTHVNAAFALARDVAPAMIKNKRGSIIFMASMVSFMGVPNVVAYSTAKSAVLGLTRGLAAEWSPAGVRVNAIAPGWIHTPMTDKAFANDQQRKDKVLSRTPMQKMGEPEDIANMAVYLCSPLSKFVTGQCLRVDGGASIGF